MKYDGLHVDFTNPPGGFNCSKSGSQLCGEFDEDEFLKRYYADDPMHYQKIKQDMENFKTQLEMYENE